MEILLEPTSNKLLVGFVHDDQDSRPHAQSTKVFILMKAQTIKVFAISDEQALHHKEHFCGSSKSYQKKPQEVPNRTRKPKRKANKSVATPPKKIVALESTIQKSKSYYRMLYEKTSPSGYKWVPKTKVKWVPKVRKEDENTSISPTIDNASRITNIMRLILFIIDSSCTKHMTGNLKLLCNFVEKYLGTVHFVNDQFAPILGYGDLVQGNITINRVYYVEGLNHNLFSISQFCDADLEETSSPTLICFIVKASPTQAWLWHRRLSHLNFDYINLLSKNDIMIGLPKLKYVKDQLCSSCELSKAKMSSFKTKAVPSSKGWLNLLHMDLCGPMHVESINGKKYILLIIDDYSRYTWTLFLRSKDEILEVLKYFLNMIQHNLQTQVITVRTDRGTEFLNKTIHAYFKEEGIEHQTSTPQTPKQKGIVERQNRTLVEAARTVLSASKLPLFFWAEAIITACYTQNRSIIISTHEKTAYHIINDRKPSIRHLHIFGCTCYLTRDGDNLDKMKEKIDPCILLDLLFGPLYDEFFTACTLSVNKSSSSTDNSKQQDTPPTATPQSTTELITPTTTATAEENYTDNQAKTQVDNTHVDNVFSTPVREEAESSSRYVDLSNMHTFYQPHQSEHRWTNDHPLS
ncbi:retrovirus-related pol polyprotein from transposon TNT 1-94 [Tanacetum coccineum]